MVLEMFRWLKKRGQRRKVDKASVTEKKDEYGFEVTERRPYRAIDHIYAEIADVANTVDSIPRHRETRRPELPPRNNKLPTNRQNTSYCKWKTKSLSQRTLSLPELPDACKQEDSVDYALYRTSDSITQRRIESDIVHNKVGLFTRPDDEIHYDSSVKDLLIRLEKCSISVSRNHNYVHPGSDSGYDYSCSSSNESDINDSGLSDCYEFHISKAEQLHRLEREILLACHSDMSNMSLDCSMKNSSLTLSVQSVSVPPGLDLDDEISAYQDPKLDCRVTAPRPPHNQPTERSAKTKTCSLSSNVSLVESLPTRQVTNTDNVATLEIVKTQTVNDRGGITPFPKRALSGNRLLGDLIRKNNNNLFFT